MQSNFCARRQRRASRPRVMLDLITFAVVVTMIRRWRPGVLPILPSTPFFHVFCERVGNQRLTPAPAQCRARAASHWQTRLPSHLYRDPIPNANQVTHPGMQPWKHFLTRNSFPGMCPNERQTQKRPPRHSRKPFGILKFLVAGAGFEPATFGL